MNTQYIEIGLQVIGVASAIAAVVPNPQVTGALFIARKVLDLLACNFGNARNEK